jgi:hypothetical protein
MSQVTKTNQKGNVKPVLLDISAVAFHVLNKSPVWLMVSKTVFNTKFPVDVWVSISNESNWLLFIYLIEKYSLKTALDAQLLKIMLEYRRSLQ